MSSPWDAPPLPYRGDDDPDAIYLGVGKIMTGWETLEFELSRLYSVFCDDSDGDSMREYGKPTIARLRLDGLSQAADKFFIRKPSQEIEGEFHGILTRLREVALRRNEVAHGIVFDVQRITALRQKFRPEFRGRPQHVLIAPYYAFKQHDTDGLPAYGYTSPTLHLLMLVMAESHQLIGQFRRKLLASEKSRRSKSSRPSAPKGRGRRQSGSPKRARPRPRRSR